MLSPSGQTKRRFTWLDGVLIVLVAVAAGYLAYRVKTRLDYSWNWSVIRTYLFRRNEAGRIVPNLLIEGLLTTLRLSLWSSVILLAIIPPVQLV